MKLYIVSLLYGYTMIFIDKKWILLDVVPFFPHESMLNSLVVLEFFEVQWII